MLLYMGWIGSDKWYTLLEVIAWGWTTDLLESIGEIFVYYTYSVCELWVVNCYIKEADVVDCDTSSKTRQLEDGTFQSEL